jgi:hypothetical protein
MWGRTPAGEGDQVLHVPLGERAFDGTQFEDSGKVRASKYRDAYTFPL